MAAITNKRSPLLEKYLQSLVLHPILTKAVTNGALNFVQENLATYLSGTRPAPYQRSGILPLDLVKANKRALKLSAYGFFVSAPLAHVLMSLLQKAFAGRTSPRSKIAMILASNVIIAPIQLSVYLASVAVINGATSLGAIIKFVQMQLLPVMKMAWITGPASLIVAQKFLPAETWVPFFSFVNFVLGTVINTKIKKSQAAAKAKAEAKKDAEDKSA